jgi:geranylgeranyl pyrophosphate synthase
LSLQSVDDSVNPRPSLGWLVCEDVAEDLPRVEASMRAAIRCGDPFVEMLASYLADAGGKRLRPALTLLAAQFGEASRRDVVPVAAAVELLHIATLHHDDVVDQARTRRGRESANALWGNRASTFAGTYLFARATELFAEANADVGGTVSRAVAELWQGETSQITGAYRLDLDEVAYLTIAVQKTATLYELPCWLGARVSAVPAEHAAALAEFGHNLGVAFQLVDDILDVVSDERQLGKPTGSDLREGVYTLPVIYALRGDERWSGRMRSLLGRSPTSDPEIAEIVAILHASGSISLALDRCRSYAERARAALSALPPCSARDSLDLLAVFVLEQAGEICD